MEKVKVYEKPVLTKYENLKDVTLGLSCDVGTIVAGYDDSCSPLLC